MEAQPVRRKIKNRFSSTNLHHGGSDDNDAGVDPHHQLPTVDSSRHASHSTARCFSSRTAMRKKVGRS